MLPEVTLTNARNLSPLFDEAVRREHPVMIVRGGRERGLLLSRDALLRVLAPFAFTVDVIPEAERGGVTLWLRELEIAANGPTLAAARTRLYAAARAYASDYLAQIDFFRHLPDKARQEPHVLRLSIARGDDELSEMLFPKPGPPTGEGAASSNTSAPAGA